MHFKTALLKNTLQYCSLKIAPSKKCFSKKHILKLIPQKMHFKIAITKIFLISASINAVKGK